MPERLICFFRCSADVDHISPIIYQWAQVEGNPVSVVVISSVELFKTDYRIQFLRTYNNIEIFHLLQFIPERLRGINGNPNQLAIDGDPALEKDWIQNILASLHKPGEQRVVAFAFPDDQFARALCSEAKGEGIPCAFLPHSGSTFSKDVHKVDINEINLDPPDPYSHSSDIDEFATLLVWNSLLRARLKEGYLESGFVKILGSARYCKEWRPLLRELQTKYVTRQQDETYKIVFFLRGQAHTIWWEELARVVAIIAQLDNVTLVIQHHPRDEDYTLVDRLIATYPFLKEHLENKVEIAPREISAGALVDWSDAVLDLASSPSLEAILDNKPLLELEYLHGYRSIVCDYLPECEVRYRDEFITKLKNIYHNPDHPFYDEERRAEFLKLEVGDPTQNTLKRYTNALRSMLSNSSTP